MKLYWPCINPFHAAGLFLYPPPSQFREFSFREFSRIRQVKFWRKSILRSSQISSLGNGVFYTNIFESFEKNWLVKGYFYWENVSTRLRIWSVIVLFNWLKSFRRPMNIWQSVPAIFPMQAFSEVSVRLQ